MSPYIGLFGLVGLLFVGAAVYTLVTGRARTPGRRVDRRADPVAYWLATGFMILVAALSLWAWRRSATGDPPAAISGLFLAPYFLYLALESLRAGEIVWGNNRFPRRGRAPVEKPES